MGKDNKDFEKRLRNDLIHIMKIENDPENIKELDKWLDEAGILEVSNKIISLYSVYHE